MEKSNQTITGFGPDSNLNAVYYCRAAWRFHASSLLVGGSRCESERLRKNIPKIDGWVLYPGAIDGWSELC